MEKLFVLGSGFAGVWSAIAARRLARKNGKDLEISVISNSEHLGIRPRFYEDRLEDSRVPLQAIFEGLDIITINATVLDIDGSNRKIKTDRGTYEFDGLVYALGSQIVKPSLGNNSKIFSIDNYKDAQEFDKFLKSQDPAKHLRVGIAGAGFTGLEAAMEIPERLRKLGHHHFEIHLMERAKTIAPEFGLEARAYIIDALQSENVRLHVGQSVASFENDQLNFSEGSAISIDALLWSGGVKPAPLSSKLSSSTDQSGRILVSRKLEVPDQVNIWAAGDVAAAMTDQSNRSVMSCQHAIPQGKIAGYNAAAKLLGLKQINYEQQLYVVCLDLGNWGALLTSGWDRNNVLATKKDAKGIKALINLHQIYPPTGNAKAVLKAAAPDNIGFLKSTLLTFALSTKFARDLVVKSTLKNTDRI